MTLRKPEETGLVRWLCAGWNLRTLMLAVIAIVASHYAQGTRITVVEAQQPTMQKHLDELEKQKVDLEMYEQDQRRIAEELKAIQDGQGRIETILMQRRGD